MTLPVFQKEGNTKLFELDESPVRKAGLTPISVEIKEFSLPETKLIQETGAAKLAARFLTEQSRAWSNSSFSSSKWDGLT